MAIDNPFSLDQAQDSITDDSRSRKLKALGPGLASLANPAEDIGQEPLHGGEISSTIPEDVGAPSQIATERVQRSPIVSQNASPLLSPEQRVGNLETGEEGTISGGNGPLGESQRTLSLKDFFSPQADGGAASASSSGGDIVGDVGGIAGASRAADEGLTYTRLVKSIGDPLAKYVTQNWDKFSSSLGGSAAAGAQFPGGFSLSGTGAEGAQFPQGLSLFGEGGGDALNAADYVGSLGSQAGELGGEIGSWFGPASGLAGTGISLASLISAALQGHGQDRGQYAQAAVSAVPGLAATGAQLAGLGGTAVAGLGGIGAALTPMLIPAIESLVKMFQDPNLPYGSGNMSQYKSRASAVGIPPELNQYMLDQKDPLSLFSLATGANPLSPHNEVMFSNPGGNMGDEGYNALLEQALANPEIMRQLIGSTNINVGETGRAAPDYQLTDTWRRQMAQALGYTPEQTAGLFAPEGGTSNFDRSMGMASSPAAGNQRLEDMLAWYNAPESIAGGGFGYWGPGAYDTGPSLHSLSGAYRDPSMGQVSPDQRAQLQAVLGNVINQNYPTIQNTPYGPMTPFNPMYQQFAGNQSQSLPESG